MDNNKLKDTVARVLEDIADALQTGNCGKRIKVGITVFSGEHGLQELISGAEMVQKSNVDIETVLISHNVKSDLKTVEATDEKQAHDIMNDLLSAGLLDAAVTMHYSFPIGVSTVGRVVTPARGRELFIATTTGASAADRTTAMLRNTIYGIAAAKACGYTEPSVGILNIESARQVEKCLRQLKDNGYQLNFAESARSDGGSLMRGNDLLLGVPDVLVTDSLTGNVLVKVLSAFYSGGNYETVGYGYGPGIGEGYDRIICIVSRASGAPVVANAVRYAADLVKGNIFSKVKEEFTRARKAGFDNVCNYLKYGSGSLEEKKKEVGLPPVRPLTGEIPGIDVQEMDSAVRLLWKNGIYASAGMGCTGPIIQVSEEELEKAKTILREHKYLY